MQVFQQLNQLELHSAGPGIGPGDPVRIAFMGKVLIEVSGRNRPAFSALYQLARVDAS